MSDVHFSNITIECNRKDFYWWGNGDPIWLVVKKRYPDSKIGSISNVSFQNITASGQGTSKLEGFPGHPLQDIRMSNIRIKMEPESTPDKRCEFGFEAHDVKDLYIENMELKWNEESPQDTWKKAFNFYDVDGLKLVGVNGEEP